MNKLYPVLFIMLFIISCGHKSRPDVTGINVELKTIRFEREFFAIDTNDISNSLDRIYNKYPGFFGDFSQHILGLPPINYSGTQVMTSIKRFLHDYRPVYDSVRIKYPDFAKQEKEIIYGLKHVKYYFPEYPLPSRLITFIGPMDAFFEASTGGYGDVITTDGLAVGLQLHLGNNFSMYTSEMGLSLYPSYISRKFTPEYIPVNSIKNIIDDLFPEQGTDKTLIEQMVEKGKRIYLTDKLLPNLGDTLKIGYTARQLKGCYSNEGLIWNYFIRNSLVFNNDPSLIKNYIGDSPNTPEFGEDAPGNIGLFVGWQIVKKYMDKNGTLPLTKLMQTGAKKIFEESHYRPK